MTRYVVLDPHNSDPTYGVVEDAIIVDSDLPVEEFEEMLRLRGEGFFYLDETSLTEALATDYELDQRD
jgi:hypothetical protein